MSLEQEVPIFSKAKKDFTPSDKITHVAIANKQLVVAMANNTLFRMNLNNPQQQDGGNYLTFLGSILIDYLQKFLSPNIRHLAG